MKIAAQHWRRRLQTSSYGRGSQDNANLLQLPPPRPSFTTACSCAYKNHVRRHSSTSCLSIDILQQATYLPCTPTKATSPLSSESSSILRQRTNKQASKHHTNHTKPAERQEHSIRLPSTSQPNFSNTQKWVSCGLKALAESTQVRLPCESHMHTLPWCGNSSHCVA